MTPFGSSYLTPAEWRVKSRGQVPGYGKPTDENLAKHVKVFEESTRPGGCNEHCGPMVVMNARVVDQDTGATLATYRGPSFVVL